MKKRVLLSSFLTATLVLGVTVVNWAKVPPPPVNQTLGIYDTTFTGLTRPDCLSAAPCHVSDAVVVPRHHNLTLPPRQLSCYGDPLATTVTGCHQLISDGAGGFTLADFRDCLKCHNKSPHHITLAAQNQDCKACHGSLIDNPLDGHTIPTYAKSSVTPETKWRGNNTSSPQNYGGCMACHQEDGTATPRPIASNANTHHGTGIGAPTSTTGQPIVVGDCNWCHLGALGTPSFLDIRGCERCHGIKSLHNIQVNSDNPNNLTTIVPGAENPGYGHIGADFDCWGCHGTFKKYDATPASATVPFVNSLSSRVLTADKPNVLTITGASLTNSSNGTDYTPTVVVSNGSTSITALPVSVTESEIKVSIPALPEGNYNLLVMKSDKQSNLTRVSVVPELLISNAVLSATKSLTITGTGFGTPPPTNATSGLGVFAADGSEAKIVFWSDSKIIASNPTFATGSTIAVKTLYGPVTSKVYANAKKVKR